MKYTLAFIALAIASIGIASCTTETTYSDMSQLPQSVQQVVTDNFDGNVVSVYVEDNSIGENEYEIVLDNGTKVKFEGEMWDEVTVPAGSTVPQYFIPSAVATYVTTNMPERNIVKIDREDGNKGYEVKLDNNIELNFDANGAFLGID